MPSASLKPCSRSSAVTVKAVSSVPAASVACVPVSSGSSSTAVSEKLRVAGAGALVPSLTP